MSVVRQNSQFFDAMIRFYVRQERSIPNTCLFLWCFLFFVHCNDTFQPLQENNQYNFNISGYLDVSADTQWIRVGTSRESIDEPPDPSDIKVTLKDLQNGDTVDLYKKDVLT